MALKHISTGEYHKIVFDYTDNQLTRDRVLVRIFKDEYHRQDVKTNGEQELRFICSESQYIILTIDLIQVLLEGVWDIDKDVSNNYLAATYNYIKTLDECTDFIDC